MQRKINDPLNDGFLEFGLVKTERNEKKEKVGETFRKMGGLYFSFNSIRQQDTDVYSTTDNQLDLKVKTQYTNEFKLTKSHKVKINDEVYIVLGLDPDNKRKYLYWHLSKVGEFDDRGRVVSKSN